MTSEFSNECAFCGEKSAKEFCSTACREAWWLDIDLPLDEYPVRREWR